MNPLSRSYWINTISLEHVLTGVEGGFTQADHGKAITLKKLSMGDLIVFYSPRIHFRGGELLQKFTAVWTLSWPEQEQAGILPVTLEAFFGHGFHHPHLRDATVGVWPLNVFSDQT